MRGSPSTSCVSFANAFMLSLVRAFVGGLCHGVRLVLRLLLAQSPLDRLDVEPGVPDVEVARLGQLPHPLAVGADRVQNGFRAFGVGEVAVAAGDLEARREPLHVPLERSGQRLVEVVEVEDERALGRGVAADVGEVGVAAELRAQSGPGVGARSCAITAAAPR